MDYRRPTLGFLLSLTLSLAASCAPRAPLQGETPPEILKWVKPDTDVVQLLSVEPAECLSAALVNDPDIQLGRAAFRSPFLLGGQAARQGLTCQACHRQGQTSSDFFVVGLSDVPGTADVTNFHFSDDLGDEVFNPSPIPSLSDDIQGVDYDPQTSALDELVTRLITKEFTGDAPDPKVFSALLAYLRALDLDSCAASDADSPPLLEREALLRYNLNSISNMFAALKGASYPAVSKEFMIASLRSEIGRLYSRYPGQSALQKKLIALGQLLNARDGAVGQDSLLEADMLWTDTLAELESSYTKSLFNPAFIEKWAASQN